MNWNTYRIETPLENYEVKARDDEHVREYIGHVRLRYMDMAVWSIKGLAPYEYDLRAVNLNTPIETGARSLYVKRLDDAKPNIPFSNKDTGLEKPDYRALRSVVAKAEAGSNAYGIDIHESDDDFITIAMPIQSELDGDTKFTRTSGDDATYTVWDIATMCLIKGANFPAYEYAFTPLIECEQMEIYVALRNLLRENFASNMMRGLWGSFSEHKSYFNMPKATKNHDAEYMKRKGLAHMWRLSELAVQLGKSGSMTFPIGRADVRKIVRNYRADGTNEQFILNLVAYNVERVKGTIRAVHPKLRLINLEKFRVYLSQVI